MWLIVGGEVSIVIEGVILSTATGRVDIFKTTISGLLRFVLDSSSIDVGRLEIIKHLEALVYAPQFVQELLNILMIADSLHPITKI